MQREREKKVRMSESEGPKPHPSVASVDLDTRPLLKAGSWIANLKKVQVEPDEDRPPSNQGADIGRKSHLLDYEEVANLRDHNVHHSTCLEAKARSTVSLGHKSEKVAELLDPLCESTWQELLDMVEDDREEYGNGFIEVIRDDSGEIVALYHIAPKDIWVYVEENRNTYHYEVTAKGAFSIVRGLGGLRFARFGDRDDFIARKEVSPENKHRVSEVIHFTTGRGRRSPYYGYPSWIAGTPAMELDQCVTQYCFDFFFNGGVPEGIFSVLGGRMDPEDWKALQDAFKAHTGIGRRRKLMLLNLHQGDEMKAQLDRLTMDGQTTGDNQALVDDQALKIVSAHRVPPLIAGIQIPGKLGAANEMSNAMMAFQTLVVGPSQRAISGILAKTLGDPQMGVKGLTPDDFLVGEEEEEMAPEGGPGLGLAPQAPAAGPVAKEGDIVINANAKKPTAKPAASAQSGKKPEPKPEPEAPPAPAKKPQKGNGFRTIVEEIDMGAMDTASRMKTSMAEAKSNGRDLKDGLAERGGEL